MADKEKPIKILSVIVGNRQVQLKVVEADDFRPPGAPQSIKQPVPTHRQNQVIKRTHNANKSITCFQSVPYSAPVYRQQEDAMLQDHFTPSTEKFDNSVLPKTIVYKKMLNVKPANIIQPIVVPVVQSAGLGTSPAASSQLVTSSGSVMWGNAVSTPADFIIHDNSHLPEAVCTGVPRSYSARLRRYLAICSQCGDQFVNEAILRRHELLSHQTFNCQYCNYKLNSKVSLVEHERSHTGERPYQCQICSKTFARKANFSVHLRLHLSGQRFFCRLCGKWFRSESEQVEHENRCSGDVFAPPPGKMLRYKCSYCDRMFQYKRDIRVHERVHTGDRPYQCGYCGNSFTQSHALTTHLRIHTGERPFGCERCGARFVDTSALRKHEFLHRHLPDQKFEPNKLPVLRHSDGKRSRTIHRCL